MIDKTRFSHGAWFQLVHDPDGFSRFYGLMSAQSFKCKSSMKNWLPGTRFQKYNFGKKAGVFVVRHNGEGNELVRM